MYFLMYKDFQYGKMEDSLGEKEEKLLVLDNIVLKQTILTPGNHLRLSINRFSYS